MTVSPCPPALHALVVVAGDVRLLGAGGLCEPAAGPDPHRVHAMAVFELGAAHVLLQGAAEDHVDDLHAAAHGQQGQTALPWEPGVASCLAEVVDPATGSPAPESPRDLLRTVLERCREQLRPVVGPEPEYYLCDPAPDARGLPLER